MEQHNVTAVSGFERVPIRPSKSSESVSGLPVRVLLNVEADVLKNSSVVGPSGVEM